jgi:hypothetical protein
MAMKGSKKGAKITKSTSSPTAYGGKHVSMAGPTSAKSADNVTKRTAGPSKSGKK